METLKININTAEHTILLRNIKMNQNGFSYNSITFSKIDDKTVEVKYKKETTEDDRSGVDCNLNWALNDIIEVITEYNKPGSDYYNKHYVMFEYKH